MCALTTMLLSFSTQQISKTINDLTICCPGYDNIHTKIIKYDATFIAMHLSHIIDCSLLTGIVSSNFNIARLVPIYINVKRDDPCNYRPVSQKFWKSLLQIDYSLF